MFLGSILRRVKVTCTTSTATTHLQPVSEAVVQQHHETSCPVPNVGERLRFKNESTPGGNFDEMRSGRDRGCLESGTFLEDDEDTGQ